MMTAKGVFERKPTSLEPQDCIIEKVIRLSGYEYDSFVRRLAPVRDFIRENAELMRVDSEDRVHCLLVVGKDRRDGILVNSEGAGYARKAAFFPNAENFLIAERYPALMEFNKKLVEIAEYITEKALETHVNDPDENRTAVNMEQALSQFGIDAEFALPYKELISDMINVDGIDSVELDNNDLYIYWEETSPELSSPPAERQASESVSETDLSLQFDGRRLAAWRAKVEANPGICWREDERHRKVNDGALYYIGGESGQYMKLTKDGKIMAGEKVSALLEAVEINTSDTKLINEITEAVERCGDYIIERAQAILSSGLASVDSVSTLIDFLDEDNIYRFNIIAASNEEELGQYWLQEDPDVIPEGMSAEEYGRECVKKEKGVFTRLGYIYERESKEIKERGAPEAAGRHPAYTPKNITPVTVKDGKKTYTSVVKTIEKAKAAPKSTSKNKSQDKAANKKDKGDDAL